MVDISYETELATHTRLISVLKSSDIEYLAGRWIFTEHPHSKFPACINPEALAIVLDNEICSQLVRATADTSLEVFNLFCVHFPNNIDNSGFVGWLASLIKRETGSGVFVTCGYNKTRGGVFDYWGYPPQANAEIKSMIKKLCN